jgi:hypothetical protein
VVNLAALDALLARDHRHFDGRHINRDVPTADGARLATGNWRCISGSARRWIAARRHVARSSSRGSHLYSEYLGET